MESDFDRKVVPLIGRATCPITIDVALCVEANGVPPNQQEDRRCNHRFTQDFALRQALESRMDAREIATVMLLPVLLLALVVLESWQVNAAAFTYAQSGRVSRFG